MNYLDIKRELVDLTNEAATKLKSLTAIDRAPWAARTSAIDAALAPLLPKLAFYAYNPDPENRLDPLLFRCLATLRSSCRFGVTSMGVYAYLQLLYTVGTPMAALLHLRRIALLLAEPTCFVELDGTRLGTHLSIDDVTGYESEQLIILRSINERVMKALEHCLPEMFDQAFIVFEALFQMVNLRTISKEFPLLITPNADFNFKRFVASTFAPGGTKSDELKDLYADYKVMWTGYAMKAQLSISVGAT